MPAEQRAHGRPLDALDHGAQLEALAIVEHTARAGSKPSISTTAPSSEGAALDGRPSTPPSSEPTAPSSGRSQEHGPR